MPHCATMANTIPSAGVSRPTQLGGEANPAFPVVRDWASLQHTHEPAPPRPTSDRSGSTFDVTGTGNCTLCTVSKSVRKYPEHFCGWTRCCYKFSDEGALLGKDFEHLPVCHNYCWTLERDRLERDAQRVGAWPDAMNGLPMCHRQCYMQALAKLQDPDAEEREVVPRNRCLRERLRIPKLEHRIDEIFKCLATPPSDGAGDPDLGASRLAQKGQSRG